MKAQDVHELPWWKSGAIYQIYPRSFKDSNNDGVGDLQGILESLDYFAGTEGALGVEALWLSPVYPSPQADFGYDISDYCAIDKVYGDIDVFRRLLAECHRRGLKLVLDLVVNHTSDQHAWFLESLSSKENPRRDWYIWRDPIDGEPPNNWVSPFGTSAWTMDRGTGQYYLHTFLPQQPDLNWRNSEVQEAVLDVMRFWLDIGVDGFRLDVFNAWFKDAKLRSNPRTSNPLGLLYKYIGQRHIHDRDQPEMLPMLARMRELLESYGQRGLGERMFVGETLDEGRFDLAARYFGQKEDGLNLVFNFDLLRSPWKAATIRAAIERWSGAVPPWAWPSWVLSNHDVVRHASRHADGPERLRGRMAAVLLTTLRGTPFLYQGEEIGMREARIPFSRIQDPPGRRFWPFYRGRDGCRTPMPWNGTSSGGFSKAEPWLPMEPSFKVRNIEVQQGDPDSLFHVYRRCLALRRAHVSLRDGDFSLIDFQREALVGWSRSHQEEKALVVLNFSKSPVSFTFPGGGRWECMLGTRRGGAAFHDSGMEILGEEALVMLRR